MGAISRLEVVPYPGAVPVPDSLARRGQVFINNLPGAAPHSGTGVFSPELQQLIGTTMPLVDDLSQHHHIQHRPVQLFYANPSESLIHNTQKLLKLLQWLQGSDHILVPFSTNHSLIFHTLRQVVPCARGMQLEDVSLFYIGAAANRNPLQAISSSCDMAFYFLHNPDLD